MCVYCNGGPDCEKCSPKFLHCPNCGEKMSLYLPSCLKCGTTFTDEMKEQAREQWRVRASSGSSEKS